MEKVLVALSGGVDSAVAAYLLKNAGMAISCVYMRTWMDETSNGVLANCPWKEDIESAQAVAKYLDVPFQVLNLIHEYEARVVRYLVEGYKNGSTPNPDIMCNKEIKFGVLLNYAIEHGFTQLATGHYCRKRIQTDGTYDLIEGIDPNKDQSYFLAMIQQEALQKVIFPIGDYTKPEIRAIAKEAGLPNADRKDSQGICFLGKVPINEFLKQYIPEKPGPIINNENKYLGQHKGLHNYTLGQRKGIGIPSNTDFEKYVVIAKNYDTNTLVVAFDKPLLPALYTTHVSLQKVHYINHPITENCQLTAKPRYRDPHQAIQFIPGENQTAKVVFVEPQRALAPGQVLAFYKDEVLLGSGYYTASVS